ncbi:hypothetical protein MRX96_051569, partial [Rhipicephalus microplus]
DGFQLGLEPGARPGAHLPRDLIDVLRSTLVILNTLHIVSLQERTNESEESSAAMPSVTQKPWHAAKQLRRIDTSNMIFGMTARGTTRRAPLEA